MLRDALAAAAMAAWPYRAAQATSSASGWLSLFDGRTLDGWRFHQEGVGDVDLRKVVDIEDGMLRFLGPQYEHDDAPPGHLSTLREWENYHLQLRFRFGEKRWSPRKLQRRNSGILYHMGHAENRLFPPCVEFQLEEGDLGDAIAIDTKALQGPSLGGTPMWPNWIAAFPQVYEEPVQAGSYRRQWHPGHGNFERIDDWNTVDLIAFEDQSAHLVNGRIVNTLFKLAKPDGAPLTNGRIALEFEWAEVLFTDIRIRPLSAAAIAALKRDGSD
ncbi:3-keto-disaccharide hydrolase [Novosphingobium sp.]|jgi:hypothetical protein|uniref:3-keto-disaccharide hydrolase n=1 Tax=Novosphingobium sp. TaxID=1874826 RepID=UPI002FE316A2